MKTNVPLHRSRAVIATLLVVAACSAARAPNAGSGGVGGSAVAGSGGGAGGAIVIAGGAGTGGAPAQFPDCQAAAAAKGSTGCDFWALQTDIMMDAYNACFAAFVANDASEPLHITIERAGQPIAADAIARVPSGQGNNLVYGYYDPVAGLPPGEVAILFLAQRTGTGQMPACPAYAAVHSADAAVTGTGLGVAFHITTDRPATVYQMLPYGGGAAAATSATLLLPRSAWDTNYIAVNAYAKSGLGTGSPSLDILAADDGTVVTMLPKAAILSGPGVPGGAAGTPWSINLDAGQYAQITQDEELTGSVIASNKPVAVWGAASCMNVPVTMDACDSGQQQLVPIKSLGSEYAAVRYRGRLGKDESPPWRLVGAASGTVLDWVPSPPAGAPATLDLGEVVELSATGPFVVSSQDAAHPFYLAGYMTGGGAFAGQGDPEWVNVVPPAQYLRSYVFFTDPTYPETSLVVVRKRSSQGQFVDVALDCAGVLTGWQPLGPYEYTRVDLVTGDFESVGGCSSGRRTMSSDAPFGVTVWGWGTWHAELMGHTTGWVSYAYPAGMSVVPINGVTIPVMK